MNLNCLKENIEKRLIVSLRQHLQKTNCAHICIRIDNVKTHDKEAEPEAEAQTCKVLEGLINAGKISPSKIIITFPRKYVDTQISQNL